MNNRPLTRLGNGAKLVALSFIIIAAVSQTATASTRTEIKKIVVEEALATKVPPSLALAVAKVESDFQARALSPKGARLSLNVNTKGKITISRKIRTFIFSLNICGSQTEIIIGGIHKYHCFTLIRRIR